MALQISEQVIGGTLVMTLSGQVRLGEESTQLRNKIKGAIGQGHKNLVLDLGDVSYVDSAGLGTLVSAYTTASNQGGSVKLANLTRRLNEQLSITKLVTVFDVFESVDEAVKSFSA